MGSVPFILYFIANGISSNIKWQMRAVWEKTKNQCMSRLCIRVGEELRLPGTAIPPGPHCKHRTGARRRARKGTLEKWLLPCPRAMVEDSSAAGIAHPLPCDLTSHRSWAPVARSPSFKGGFTTCHLQKHAQSSFQMCGRRMFPPCSWAQHPSHSWGHAQFGQRVGGAVQARSHPASWVIFFPGSASWDPKEP